MRRFPRRAPAPASVRLIHRRGFLGYESYNKVDWEGCAVEHALFERHRAPAYSVHGPAEPVLVNRVDTRASLDFSVPTRSRNLLVESSRETFPNRARLRLSPWLLIALLGWPISPAEPKEDHNAR